MAAAVLFLAACSSNSGSAPAGSPGPSGTRSRTPGDTSEITMENRGPGRAPPTFGLLGQRERLGLTSAQVTSIDSIGEALRVKNEALLRHLRALQDSLGGRDRMSARSERVLLERGAPQFAAMRANNLEATRAVYDVLTPAQRVTSCTLMREVRGGEGGSLGQQRQRQGMNGRGTMRQPMPGDSIRSRRQQLLFWCPADTSKAPVRP